MHRDRILAQFSLILSILNLVIATPIVVQRIHKARHDELVAAEDVAAMLGKWHAASDRSPRSPPGPDDVEDPQRSSLSDASMSSGTTSPPHVSATDLLGPNSLPLHPNPSPNTPAPTLATPLMTPGIPQSGENPAYPPSSGPGPSANQLPEGPQELQAERPPSQLLPAGLASPLASHSHSLSWSGEIPHMPIPDRLRIFELVPGRVITPQRTGSDQATTEAHRLPDQSTPEGLATSQHLTSDAPPSHPSLPTVTFPDHLNHFFDKELLIPAAVGILGLGVMAIGIADLVVTAHKYKQDN